MTPSPAQQPQREHCEHECVCTHFRSGSKIAWRDGTQCMRNREGCNSCTHDTRSRPHPPAPETLGDLIAKTNAGSLQAMIDEQCKEAARTATLAENKRVLDELLAKCKAEELRNKAECDRGDIDNISSFQLRARQGAFERCCIWIEEIQQSTTAEGREGQR
jgi:hypothetical protein